MPHSTNPCVVKLRFTSKSQPWCAIVVSCLNQVLLWAEIAENVMQYLKVGCRMNVQLHHIMCNFDIIACSNFPPSSHLPYTMYIKARSC